jgi:CDP-glycerol glycerophosphotransferase
MRATISVPTISVIVSFHDNEDDYATCLDSVAAQTHRRLEVIEVEDGGSPGAARNRGLEAATGDFLAFVDGNVVLPANAYELMLHSLEYTGSDFASGYADQGRLERTHISKNPGLLYDVSAGTKLFRRSFWELHRLRYTEGAVAGGPGQSNAAWGDIQLMTMAHVLARKVDLIPDAICLRQGRVRAGDSVAELRDRMITLAAIDTLLASYGPARLLRAHQAKALTDDLWRFVRDMHKASQAYRAEFAVLVAPYLDTVSPKVLRNLPATNKLAYRLVREGAMPELAQFANWLTKHPERRLRQGRGGFAEGGLGEVGHALGERRERGEADVPGGGLG